MSKTTVERERQTGDFVDDRRGTRSQWQCGGSRNHSGCENKKDEPESNDPIEGLQDIQTMRGAGKCSIESRTCERKAVGRRGGGREEPNGQWGTIRDDKRSSDNLPMRRAWPVTAPSFYDMPSSRHLPFTVYCRRDSLSIFENWSHRLSKGEGIGIKIACVDPPRILLWDPATIIIKNIKKI